MVEQLGERDDDVGDAHCNVLRISASTGRSCNLNRCSCRTAPPSDNAPHENQSGHPVRRKRCCQSLGCPLGFCQEDLVHQRRRRPDAVQTLDSGRQRTGARSLTRRSHCANAYRYNAGVRWHVDRGDKNRRSLWLHSLAVGTMRARLTRVGHFGRSCTGTTVQVDRLCYRHSSRRSRTSRHGSFCGYGMRHGVRCGRPRPKSEPGKQHWQ